MSASRVKNLRFTFSGKGTKLSSGWMENFHEAREILPSLHEYLGF